MIDWYRELHHKGKWGEIIKLGLPLMIVWSLLMLMEIFYGLGMECSLIGIGFCILYLLHPIEKIRNWRIINND